MKNEFLRRSARHTCNNDIASSIATVLVTSFSFFYLFIYFLYLFKCDLEFPASKYGKMTREIILERPKKISILNSKKFLRIVKNFIYVSINLFHIIFEIYKIFRSNFGFFCQLEIDSEANLYVFVENFVDPWKNYLQLQLNFCRF